MIRINIPKPHVTEQGAVEEALEVHTYSAKTKVIIIHVKSKFIVGLWEYAVTGVMV